MLPFLLAGAAATARPVVFPLLHCYESNPATSGCRPTRNNCVWGFAELDGLYISCQPQKPCCFSPDHVALAGQPAVRRLHAEIPVAYQRSHFIRPFPGRAHVHCPQGHVHCRLKQFISLFFSPCNSAAYFKQQQQQQQTSGRKSKPACRAVYLLATRRSFIASLSFFFAQKTTVNAFFLMFDTLSTLNNLTIDKYSD